MIRTYKIEVFGRVQMVGFRWFTQRLAKQLNIKGNIKNTIIGTVEIIAEGEEEKLNLFVGQIKKGPTAANVTNLVKDEITTKKNGKSF